MSEDPRIALINRAFEDFEARDVEGLIDSSIPRSAAGCTRR